jgi:hypothetical protein
MKKRRKKKSNAPHPSRSLSATREFVAEATYNIPQEIDRALYVVASLGKEQTIKCPTLPYFTAGFIATSFFYLLITL